MSVSFKASDLKSLISERKILYRDALSHGENEQLTLPPELLAAIFQAHEEGNDAGIIANLVSLSEILRPDSYQSEIWDSLVHHEIVSLLLLTACDADISDDVVSAMLFCLGDLMFYPPFDELVKLRSTLTVQALMQHGVRLLKKFTFPYLRVMARIATSFNQNISEIYESAVRLSQVVQLSKIAEQLHRDILGFVKYQLTSESLTESGVGVYIDWYTTLWNQHQNGDFSDELICVLMQALRTAARRFPQLCRGMFNWNFVLIDEMMQKHTNVYPMLRRELLALVKSLAKYASDNLNWNMDLLQYFGGEHPADQGVPSLEITDYILRNRVKIPPTMHYSSGTILPWILARLTQLPSYGSQVALWKCFEGYLSRVELRADERELYSQYLDALGPLLFQFVSSPLIPALSDGITPELSAIIRSIRGWFLENGFDNSDRNLRGQISALPSEPIQKRERDIGKRVRHHSKDSDSDYGSESTEYEEEEGEDRSWIVEDDGAAVVDSLHG
jgi:hypothetical protein